MRHTSVFFRLALILALFFIWSGNSNGATTGKIAGLVKDAETGEGLPGANVVIEGTQIGSATNASGEYFIINVAPGTYNVKVTMMGFETTTTQKVVVRIDRTTTVDFTLKATVLDAGGEVTVVADREIVRLDVSYTQTNLDAAAIDAIPGTFRLNDALSSQLGVGMDDQGLTIRRSNNLEIGYYIDGISTRDDRMDRDMTNFSKTNIAEVQLLTGAFDAEFGNARGGIVNVVTKDPVKKYFFNFESRMSPLMDGEDANYKGLKHFGPYIYSNENWWEYGRFDWNNGDAAPDKNGDGTADFIGWNAWAASKTYNGKKLTPEEAYKIWQWQHRSEDDAGNVYYNGEKIGTIDEMYASETTHHDALNWYSFNPDYNFDVTFGGPVPFTDGKLGFVVSHLRENSMNPVYTTNNSTYSYNTTQFKLNYTLNPNMKLSFNALYTDFMTFDESDPRPQYGVDGQTLESARAVPANSRYMFAWDSGMIPKGVWYAFTNLKWTHTISSKTFYEVKIQNTNIDYNSIANLRQRNLGSVYTVGPIVMDEAPKGWAYGTSISSDILGIYDMRRGREMDVSYTKAFRVSADMTSQISVNHQIKAGFEITTEDLLEKRGFTQNYMFYTNEAYRNGPDGVFGTEDDGSIGDQSNWHDVHVFPWRGGAYLRDRMEFGGMILNLGLRADLHQPFTWFDRNDMFMPSGEEYWDLQYTKYGPNAHSPNYYGLPADTEPPLEVNFSPRFGISHPIGPESKIYFNYGHFYDIPSAEYLYRFQLGVGEPLEHVGNPWLDMTKTIQFEAGYEQRIYGDFVATIRGYYKDVSGAIDELSIESRKATDPGYEINSIGRDIKGFEFQLEKKYGQFFTGFFNADYSTEKVSYYGWHHLYHPEHENVFIDPTYVSYLRVVSDPFVNTQVPGSWTAKLNFSAHTPADWGPGGTFLGAKLLGWWQINLYHTWRQGAPYTWNPDGLQSLVGVFNHRNKDYNWTQLRVEKQFQIGRVTAAGFMEVTNLFNVKNLYDTNWSNLTSRFDAGNASKMEKAYMAAILEEGKKRGEETDDPTLMPQRLYRFWGAPRDWWFGLQIYF